MVPAWVSLNIPAYALVGNAVNVAFVKHAASQVMKQNSSHVSNAKRFTTRCVSVPSSHQSRNTAGSAVVVAFAVIAAHVHPARGLAHAGMRITPSAIHVTNNVTKVLIARYAIERTERMRIEKWSNALRVASLCMVLATPKLTWLPIINARNCIPNMNIRV